MIILINITKRSIAFETTLKYITGNYIWGLTSMGNALWENLYKSEYTLSNFVLTDWLVYDR